MGWDPRQLRLDAYLWRRNAQPPFTGGREKQCSPPPPKAGIWGRSDESRSRNACFLAVIIQKVWMSSSSAAIWSRKAWLHYLESKKSRLYFLLVSHFGWHSKATKWTKAERHPDSVPGRRFVSCSQNPGLKGCTRHNAVKNQTQEPPSKLHSYWAPASAIHPKHWRLPRAPYRKEFEMFSRETVQEYQ